MCLPEGARRLWHHLLLLIVALVILLLPLLLLHLRLLLFGRGWEPA